MTSRIKVQLPELRRLILKGLSTADIAAHFGVQPPAITRACRANGLDLPHGKNIRAPRRPGEPTRADDERALDCIRRVLAGEGYQAVADRYGMSNVTVQKIVREVEAADIAESGEPVMTVARHYAFKRRKRA